MQAAREPRPTVRMTVDMTASDHAALAQLCLDAAQAAGRPRLHAQQLARALLRRVLVDSDLLEAVIADMREGRDKLNQA